MMNGVNRLAVEPQRTPRTVRSHPLSILTSMMPGVCAPIAVMPLLREDALSASGVKVTVEMMETHELMMNATNLRVTAWYVPKQAFDRFQQSRDQLDRSYMQQPQIDGGATIPYFESGPLGGPISGNAVLKTLGLHALNTDVVNTDYLEAYNQIINYRLRNRSPNLTKRARLDGTLAPAFWLNSQWQHVVPDFDQGTMDGQVTLDYVNNRLNVRGLSTGGTALAAGQSVRANYDGSTQSTVANPPHYNVWATQTPTGGPATVFAELADGGLTVSLADLAMAKKAQWFAKIRERYQGWADGNALDEYIIDMMMSGLSIPDQAMKQPMLCADVTTKFSQAKRYATDYANMAESAVSGSATVEFDIRIPRQEVGGVVMIIAEAMPDQLFERQRDPYYFTTGVSQLPEYMRDELDTQKVDIVLNGQVDANHATPFATFGYEPLNGKWNRWGPRIGGKFHRPATGATNDEVRQRLWAIEQLNPTLGTSFYLVPAMNLKPFLDTVNDPFEITVSGGALIQGNTVFGPELVEQTNLYAKVLAKAPTTQAKPT